MKKILIPLIMGVTLLSTSGCSMYWKIKCPLGGSPKDCEGEIGGKKSFASTFRPIIGMLASAGVLTYEDWLGFDPNEYEIKFDESQSITTIDGNQVEVKLTSNDVVIATQNFAVVKNSNRYKFANASAVKTWAEGFIGTADGVKVGFDVSSAGTGGANTTVSMLENNTLQAATSFTSVTGGNNGGGSTMIQ